MVWVLGIGSHKLGNHSATEPHPHLFFLHVCNVHLTLSPPNCRRPLPAWPSPIFMPSSTFSYHPLSFMGAAHPHIRGRAIYWGSGNLTRNDTTTKDKWLSLSRRLPIAPQLGVGPPKLCPPSRPSPIDCCAVVVSGFRGAGEQGGGVWQADITQETVSEHSSFIEATKLAYIEWVWGRGGQINKGDEMHLICICGPDWIQANINDARIQIPKHAGGRAGRKYCCWGRDFLAPLAMLADCWSHDFCEAG